MSEKSSRLGEAIITLAVIGGVVGIHRQLSLGDNPTTPNEAQVAKLIDESYLRNKYNNIQLANSYNIQKRQLSSKPTRYNNILSKIQKVESIDAFDELKQSSYVAQQCWLKLPQCREKLKKMYQQNTTLDVTRNSDATFTFNEIQEVSQPSDKSFDLTEVIKCPKIVFLEDFADKDSFYRPIVSCPSSANIKGTSKEIYINTKYNTAEEMTRNNMYEKCTFKEAPNHPNPLITKGKFYTYYNQSFMETLNNKYHCNPKILLKFNYPDKFKKQVAPYTKRLILAEIRVLTTNDSVSDDMLQKIMISHFGNECSNIIISHIS